MKVKRQKFKNETKTFEFDVNSYIFLVKNLTDDDVYVCLVNSFDENTAIKIPSYMSQPVTENINHTVSAYSYDTITIKSPGEGEVEVQCLKY